MPEKQQRVALVRHTADPEALTALGARLCYAGGDIDRLLSLIETKDQKAFVEKIMSMGHESVLEHVSFTFLIEGVSRVLLAQLTRHRIASFSVQSQRYVSYASGFGYIVPPAIEALGEEAVAEYEAQMAQMQSWYEGWQKRLGELTETLDLKSILHTPLRQLSLGQRMRAELAGSLLHSPELLFLDEPTIGLDAVSKLRLRDFLKYENAQHKTTIMLTTHDMDDIQELCSRVCVLGHGQMLFDGKLPDLLSRYDTLRFLKVRYAAKIELPSLPEGCAAVQEEGMHVITYDPARVPVDKLLSLLQNAGAIAEMTAQSQSIDHLIARMYEEMQL